MSHPTSLPPAGPRARSSGGTDAAARTISPAMRGSTECARRRPSQWPVEYGLEADPPRIEASDRDTISFLIASHLEISATLRRDIYDPATIQSFSEKIGTPERLKMLSLLTYADIKAVNPEALTPWKAENVWQLYIAASNCMSRTADQRVHEATEQDETVARLKSLAPALAGQVKPYLEGLPRRYLRTYRAEEILQHMQMAEKLSQDTSQLHLERGRHWYELTVVTKDRPFLFANIAGSLAAWGMNIVKADVLLHRSFSDSRTESVGAGALPAQRRRRSEWRGRPGPHAGGPGPVGIEEPYQS